MPDHGRKGDHAVTYEEAMNEVRGRPSLVLTRDDAPYLRVSWRFGSVVQLTEADRYIRYTATADDLYATDWTVIGT